MSGGDEKNPSERSLYFYSIRIWVKNSLLTVEDISAALDMDPDYSWEVGARENDPASMWSVVTWTKGERDFFDEIHDVLLWLKERSIFLDQLKMSGGECHVIVQLPGGINMGSSMRPNTALLAATLGIFVGVEVFPRLSDN